MITELEQTIKIKKVLFPKSSTWHKDLLNLAVSFEIITEKLSDELYKYLSFRHFFVHGYGFMLEEVYLKELADNITNIWTQFIEESESNFK